MFFFKKKPKSPDLVNRSRRVFFGAVAAAPVLAISGAEVVSRRGDGAEFGVAPKPVSPVTSCPVTGYGYLVTGGLGQMPTIVSRRVEYFNGISNVILPRSTADGRLLIAGPTHRTDPEQPGVAERLPIFLGGRLRNPT